MKQPYVTPENIRFCQHVLAHGVDTVADVEHFVRHKYGSRWRHIALTVGGSMVISFSDGTRLELSSSIPSVTAQIRRVMANHVAHRMHRATK